MSGPSRLRVTRIAALVATVTVLFSGASCGSHAQVAGPGRTTSAPAAAAPGVQHVVVISLDGLNPAALKKLGPRRTPVLHRFIKQGTSTLNARTAFEMTVTLPNHTSMVTSRKISVSNGGHGVTWNDDRTWPNTVQQAAGGPVGSVFTSVKESGGTTALFASKTKFSLWTRSWPNSFDRAQITEDNLALARQARRDIVQNDRDFTFVHLSAADVAGHARGWLSKPYLRAVRADDRNVGIILRGIANAGEADSTVVIITADHGGYGKDHSNAAMEANYRIPFLVRGPGVAKRTDLYAVNPDFADPGKRRPRYDAPRQPVRNGMVGNLALSLLGLPSIPGSQLDTSQNLVVTTAP